MHRVARPRADDCGEYEAGRDANAGKLVRYREQAGAEDRLEGVDERQREAKAERSSGFNSWAVPSSGSLAIRQQCGTERQLLIARAVLAAPP